MNTNVNNNPFRLQIQLHSDQKQPHFPRNIVRQITYKISFLQNSDNSADDTSTSVASLLGVRVISPAIVISTRVEDQSPADDVVATVQLDLRVYEVDVGGLRVVKLNVSEVSDVTDLIMWMSVVMSVGVEMSTSGEAAVGQVSGLMDVETVHASRHTSHLASDVDPAII